MVVDEILEDSEVNSFNKVAKVDLLANESHHRHKDRILNKVYFIIIFVLKTRFWALLLLLHISKKASLKSHST